MRIVYPKQQCDRNKTDPQYVAILGSLEEDANKLHEVATLGN